MKDFDKAMSLRDSDFREALDGFKATAALDKEPLLPHHMRMRVAIMQYVSPRDCGLAKYHTH